MVLQKSVYKGFWLSRTVPLLRISFCAVCPLAKGQTGGALFDHCDVIQTVFGLRSLYKIFKTVFLEKHGFESHLFVRVSKQCLNVRCCEPQNTVSKPINAPYVAHKSMVWRLFPSHSRLGIKLKASSFSKFQNDRAARFRVFHSFSVIFVTECY